MISRDDILTAINEKLVEQYPDWTVHVERIPKGFRRPCFHLYGVAQTQRNHGYDTVEISDYYTVVGFVAQDKYGNSKEVELRKLQDALGKLFRMRSLPVGSRFLTVESSTGEVEDGTARVDIALHYYDSRGKAEPASPLMETVTINQKGEG